MRTTNTPNQHTGNMWHTDQQTSCVRISKSTYIPGLKHLHRDNLLDIYPKRVKPFHRFLFLPFSLQNSTHHWQHFTKVTIEMPVGCPLWWQSQITELWTTLSIIKHIGRLSVNRFPPLTPHTMPGTVLLHAFMYSVSFKQFMFNVSLLSFLSRHPRRMFKRLHSSFRAC